MSRDTKYQQACETLGKFVWYYPLPVAGRNLIAAPGPRPDGKPLDANIIGLNDDGTVEIRAWGTDGLPHELDNVHIYDGDLMDYPFAVYPADDDGRIKQEAEKVKHEHEAALKVQAKAEAEARTHARR